MSGEGIDAALLARLRAVGTATLSMQLLKRGLRNTYLNGPKPLDPAACRFAGPAHTLRFIPMREDLSRPEVLGAPGYPPRAVIEAIAPGDVLAIDARGEAGAGVIGDILTTRLRQRGAAAVVADGPVRDGAAVAAIGLPVFATGAAAPASLARHFGADSQVAIGCGGVAVLPGDILVGDGDGVIVLPRALAAEIAADGEDQALLEEFLLARVRDGAPTIGTYPPDAVTQAAFEAWRKDRGR